MTRLTRILILAAAGAALCLMTAAPVAVASEATDGFIYGTVTTRSGNSYTGVIRWGTEESFWDDLFHSSKDELPYAEYAEEQDEDTGKDERWWNVFGRRMNVVFGSEIGSRVFITRFGDISSIEVVRKKGAAVTMRSGETLEVSGYANDVGAVLTVRDPEVGEIEVPWKKIETIVFKPTPAGADVPGYRLHGTVETDLGVYDGFIQWDSQECLSSDELDGDSDDGRMSIEMGKIRTIERRSRRSSKVTLKDGRELTLDGTNDVDSSIRGILVEDSRYGRVKIPWSAFDKVDFRDAGGSGRAYDEYPKPGPLRGKVVLSDGVEHSGDLVFDLDEAVSWEMLNGSSFDVEYTIPFSLVKSVEPRGSSAATVTLRTGEELRLEDSQDVSRKNDGVLVLAGGKTEAKWFPWKEIDSIDLD